MADSRVGIEPSLTPNANQENTGVNHGGDGKTTEGSATSSLASERQGGEEERSGGREPKTSGLICTARESFWPLTPTKRKYLINRLLETGEIVLLDAPMKKGKSAVALHMALCVASGKPVFGEFSVTEPRCVLYLDKENASWLVADRIQRMCASLGISREEYLELPFHYFRRPPVWLDREEDRKKAAAFIDEVHPALIIYDTNIHFHLKNHNDATEVVSLFASWFHPTREIFGVSQVILAHQRKGSSTDWEPDAGKMVMGSYEWVGQVDGQWQMKGGKEDDTYVFSIPNQRQHVDLPPFSLKFNGFPETGTFDVEYLGPEAESEARRREIARAEDLILELLPPGQTRKTGEISSHLDAKQISQRTTERALRGLVTRGMLEQPGRGLYARRPSPEGGTA